MSVHPKCQRQKCKSGAAHERRKGECKSIVEQKPQTQTQAEYAKFRFRLEISNLTGPRDSWNRACNLRLTKRISRRLKELMHQALGPIDIDMVPCTVASWSKMTRTAFKKAKRFHISNLPPQIPTVNLVWSSFPKIQFERARSITFHYLAGLSMICFDGMQVHDAVILLRFMDAQWCFSKLRDILSTGAEKHRSISTFPRTPWAATKTPVVWVL